MKENIETLHLEQEKCRNRMLVRKVADLTILLNKKDEELEEIKAALQNSNKMRKLAEDEVRRLKGDSSIGS